MKGKERGRQERRKEGQMDGHGVWILRLERQREAPLGIVDIQVLLAKEVKLFPGGNR